VPPIEERARFQKVVYFPETAPDRYNNPGLGAGVEMDARWREVFNRGEMATGFTAGLDYTLIGGPDADDVRDGWFFLGSMSEWLSAGSSSETGNLLRVVKYRETPDHRNRFRRRTLGLAYDKESHPEE
jgi:hypothetical protein